MKRNILLVDDEVAILLTLKAVLEISGFQVDTAASAKEAKLRLKKTAYAMVITDMRMESEQAGKEVIRAAKSASSRPAIALLTAFPVAEEDWQGMGADNMLVKPMQIQVLLQQIEDLLKSHDAKIAGQQNSLDAVPQQEKSTPARIARKASSAKKSASKKSAVRKKRLAK